MEEENRIELEEVKMMSSFREREMLSLEAVQVLLSFLIGVRRVRVASRRLSGAFID